MKTQEEIMQYVDQLVAQGVGAYTAAPPINRLLWRWGFNITPPLNQTFLKNAWFFGFGFSALIVIFVIPVSCFFDWQIVWLVLHEVTVWSGVFAGGAIFGTLLAGFNWYRARSLNVPKW